MLKDLKWHIIKDSVATKANIEVEEAEIDELAKKFARMQWMQYGMFSLPNDVLDNYVAEMKKKPETLRNLSEKVLEDKVLAVVKEQVKLDKKTVSFEEFNKILEKQK